MSHTEAQRTQREDKKSMIRIGNQYAVFSTGNRQLQTVNGYHFVLFAALKRTLKLEIGN